MRSNRKGYSLSELIGKYGAKHHLEGLRARLIRGDCSYPEYAFYAARGYLMAAKPRRAIALLESIDPWFSPRGSRQNAADILSQSFAALEKKQEKTCSLNMIVRNESEHIENALNSVDDLVDEMVIVDTGSTDNTIEIARRYGVRILRKPWANDFSAARNQAIERSTCDWIFWMDADDRLAPDSLGALRKLWQTGMPQVAAVCVANEQQGERGPEFLQFRLFPRDPDIRFERPVHEQMVFSARKKGLPATSYDTVRVLHIGYCSARRCKSKAQRNLPLIITGVDQRPDDLSLRMSLGECYSQLGENQKALKIFLDTANDRTVWERDRDVFTQAHFAAGWLLKALGRTHEAKRYLYRCLYLNDSYIEAFLELGLIWYGEKNLEKAFHCMVKAADTSPNLRLVSAVDRRSVKMRSVYYLAEILLAWGRNKPARDLLERALHLFPQVLEFYSQMGRALIGLGMLTEAARYFTRSLELSPKRNPEAYVGIARLYSLLNSPARAAEYLSQALANESASPEVYALAGDLHYEAGNATDAVQAYKEAGGSDKEMTDSRLWRAASAALSGSDIPEATVFVEELLEKNPADSRAQLVHQTLKGGGKNSSVLKRTGKKAASRRKNNAQKTKPLPSTIR